MLAVLLIPTLISILQEVEWETTMLAAPSTVHLPKDGDVNTEVFHPTLSATNYPPVSRLVATGDGNGLEAMSMSGPSPMSKSIAHLS